MRSKVLVWPPPGYDNPDSTGDGKQSYIVVEDRSQQEEIEKKAEESRKPDDPEPVSQEEVMKAEGELRRDNIEKIRKVRQFTVNQAQKERRDHFEKIMKEQQARMREKFKDMRRLEREHTSTLAAAYGMYGKDTNVDKINEDFAIAKDKVNPRVDIPGMALSVQIDNALLNSATLPEDRDMKKVIMADGSISMMDKELAAAIENEERRSFAMTNEAADELVATMAENSELTNDLSEQADVVLQQQSENQELVIQQQAEEEQQLLEEQERIRQQEEENERIRRQIEEERELAKESMYTAKRVHDEMVVKNLMTAAAAAAVVGKTSEGIANALTDEEDSKPQPELLDELPNKKSGVHLTQTARSDFQIAMDDLQNTYNQEATMYYREAQSEMMERIRLERIYGPNYGMENGGMQVRPLPTVAVDYPYVMMEGTYNGRSLPTLDYSDDVERTMSF